MNYLKQKGFTLYELLVVGAILAQIAIVIAIICVAWHFISKFW